MPAPTAASTPVPFTKSLKMVIEHKGARQMPDGSWNGYLERFDDFSSVAYWYQAPPPTKLAPIPNKEARKPKSFIGVTDVHKWRDAWRKAHGGDDQLWGNAK